MPGTGYRAAQWLIQRGDRYLQVSEILYRIAELCDGSRTDEEIAVLVSAETRRNVAAGDVRAVVDSKLVPAGIIGDGAAAATAPRRSSPLGVQLGTKVIGPATIEPLARVAQIFFAPGVAIVALVASIGAHLWLYRAHGLGPAFEGVLLEPWRMAALGGIAFSAAAFHELGHATALRVAGGRARGMGFGFYLVYPVLFTDVTDSYRLGRWRRLLTDVGGFYFNLVFALGLFAAYAISRQDWILVAVAIIDFEILHQLLPLGRLDGYWILADLTGIPDFFTIGGAFARNATGGHAPLPRLRPLAKVIVAVYLALIVPIFVVLTYLVARSAPRVAKATLESFLIQATRFDEARAAEDLWRGVAAMGQGMILLLPLLGVVLFLFGMARWIVRAYATVSGRTRAQRIASGVSAAAALALLVALWSPVSAAVTQMRAAEVGVPSSGPALDSGPTLTPTVPTTSQPRVLPPAVQPATRAPASSVRSVSPMTPQPTPSNAPTSSSPTPPPSAVPPSASPSPAPTGTRP